MDTQIKVSGLRTEKIDFEKMTKRALDGFLAVKVLGWSVSESKHGHFSVTTNYGETLTSEPVLLEKYDEYTGTKLPKPKWYDHIDELPFFSCDIEQAMAMVDEVHPEDTEFDLRIEKCISEGFSGYVATLNNRFSGYGETPAHSIALALAQAYQNSGRGHAR